jgi:hypothetical protein
LFLFSCAFYFSSSCEGWGFLFFSAGGKELIS